MAGTAIRTRGLTKHFGAVRAVEAVDLEVTTGEVFGFLGPNGAGALAGALVLAGGWLFLRRDLADPLDVAASRSVRWGPSRPR